MASRFLDSMIPKFLYMPQWLAVLAHGWQTVQAANSEKIANRPAWHPKDLTEISTRKRALDFAKTVPKPKVMQQK